MQSSGSQKCFLWFNFFDPKQSSLDAPLKRKGCTCILKMEHNKLTFHCFPCFFILSSNTLLGSERAVVVLGNPNHISSSQRVDCSCECCMLWKCNRHLLGSSHVNTATSNIFPNSFHLVSLQIATVPFFCLSSL